MDLTYLGPMPPHTGGIAQHGANVADALEALGHEVERVSWRRPYPARLYPGDLVDPTAHPAPGVRYPLDWFRPDGWHRAGREAGRGDGLVVPWVTPVHGPPTARIVSAALPTPTVAIVHNALPHERHAFDRPLARHGLRRVRGALVHASAVATATRDLVPGLPVEVVPHPPNLDLAPTPLPAGEVPRALVFGFVRAYKGVEIALDAVAALHRRGMPIELTIAGRFWEPRERWEQEVSARGLDHAVGLIDRYVPDEEVADLFATHHLVLAPYLSATQSGIVPLAQAAGRPVVATTVGGLPEVVSEGVNGTLAAPDGAAFADAIVRAWDHVDDLAAGSRGSVTRWTDVAEVLCGLLTR